MARHRFLFLFLFLFLFVSRDIRANDDESKQCAALTDMKSQNACQGAAGARQRRRERGLPVGDWEKDREAAMSCMDQMETCTGGFKTFTQSCIDQRDQCYDGMATTTANTYPQQAQQAQQAQTPASTSAPASSFVACAQAYGACIRDVAGGNGDTGQCNAQFARCTQDGGGGTMAQDNERAARAITPEAAPGAGAAAPRNDGYLAALEKKIADQQALEEKLLKRLDDMSRASGARAVTAAPRASLAERLWLALNSLRAQVAKLLWGAPPGRRYTMFEPN